MCLWHHNFPCEIIIFSLANVPDECRTSYRERVYCFTSSAYVFLRGWHNKNWGHQMDLHVVSQTAPLVNTKVENPNFNPSRVHSKLLKWTVCCCTRFYLSFRCMLIFCNVVSSFHLRTILISWLPKGWYRE